MTWPKGLKIALAPNVLTECRNEIAAGNELLCYSSTGINCDHGRLVIITRQRTTMSPGTSTVYEGLRCYLLGIVRTEKQLEARMGSYAGERRQLSFVPGVEKLIQDVEIGKYTPGMLVRGECA